MALSTTLVGAFVASPAPAAARLPGPAYLQTGFVDDATFQDPDAGLRNLWFERARTVGSSWVRMGAFWGSIAPANPPPGFDPTDPGSPGYDWSYLDAAVRSATASGQQILLTIAYAPTWALGSDAPPQAPPDTWKPNPYDLGQFAAALARRYSGRFPDPLYPGSFLPRVTHFQAWNEPNINVSLSPQWTRGAGGRLVAASPSFYRRMLNAVYRGVTSVNRHAYVLAAGMAPYGDPPGGSRIGPVLFMRDLLCLRAGRLRPARCPDPAHFDGYDHHPYSINPTVHAYSPNDASVPDMGRITRLVHAAQRERRVLPAGPKQAWVTEIYWGSKPPDPNGVTLATQANYLSRAFYSLWSQGVGHILWYDIHDPGGPESGLTGAGVFFSDGTAKPAGAAFRFPFAVVGRRDGRAVVWGRAPAPGEVVIEVDRAGHWRALLRVRTTRGGIFYARRRLPRHTRVRAQIGADFSLSQATS